MKPYYQDGWVTQYCLDALTMLRTLEDDSIDLLCTDPPYGISFMGKDWDKALPDKKIWAECLRVLKPGAFAFVMSIPRSDCLSRMIVSLEDAGFWVNFTPIFWTYASGFPKAQNIGKAVDKRLGAEREIVGKNPGYRPNQLRHNSWRAKEGRPNALTSVEFKTSGNSPLEGSYGGFQPKPAVEVIIVAMEPLSEKTFVDQALKNRKGITWLDDGRIPYEREEVDFTKVQDGRIYGDGNCIGKGKQKETTPLFKQSGRFPANLLVSDDVLNDGRVLKVSGRGSGMDSVDKYHTLGGGQHNTDYGDSGSFSRYFDLDKWAQKTFPFLIVPKASKSEKNKGLDMVQGKYSGRFNNAGEWKQMEVLKAKNLHPTVKPLKLMSYLITLGSRTGDVVLDPFGGSGTTALAGKLLGRYCIISEVEEKYCEIAANRCSQMIMELRI